MFTWIAPGIAEEPQSLRWTHYKYVMENISCAKDPTIQDKWG